MFGLNHWFDGVCVVMHLIGRAGLRITHNACAPVGRIVCRHGSWFFVVLDVHVEGHAYICSIMILFNMVYCLILLYLIKVVGCLSVLCYDHVIHVQSTLDTQH